MPSESILQTPSLPPELCADSGRILRAQQAMQYLNISRNTFYRYIKRGIIPAPRYRGRTPFWRLGDLRGVYANLSATPETD